MFIPITASISTHAVTRPSRAAIICGTDQVTWHAFDLSISRVAETLRAAGVRKGSRVAIAIEQPTSFLIVFFGALRLGASIVVLSCRLSGTTFSAILVDCGAILVVVEKNNPIARQHPNELLTTVTVEELTTDSVEPSRKGEAEVGPEDEFGVAYSSGSTRRPKGVVHSHRARMAGAQRFGGLLGIDASTKTLLATPLYTTMTWATLLPTIVAGGTCLFPMACTQRDLGLFIDRERPTIAKMSPAQITMLLDDGVLAPKRVESLRLIIHGSAKADMQLKQRLSSLFPDSVAECYGSTETGPITCRMPSGPPDKLGSVGLPLPGIQLRIIDDDGRSLPHGEIGEIIVASDSLMERYQDHGENSFIRLFDQLERFHRTGDLGRLDQDGYLWHCGRRAGRIVTAGFTVHVDDIEQVLLDHPDVREAAVISWPHATLGETPVGFVVMNEGAGTREGDICMWANSRLEKHQRLMRVCRLSELPRTLIGKISLVALQKMVSNPRESSLG